MTLSHLNRVAIRQRVPLRFGNIETTEWHALTFRKMRGMRNIVAHDSANVDVTVIGDVATIHAPQPIAVLEPSLVSLGSLPPQA